MRLDRRVPYLAALSVATAILVISCSSTEPSVTGVEVVKKPHSSLTGCTGTGEPGGSEEGEVIGNLYEDGERTCSSGYSMTLTPIGFSPTYFKSGLTVDPSNAMMWEFWEPAAGWPCQGFSQTIAADTTELNHSSAGGHEGHCVLPGFYYFTLGPREYTVEYLPMTNINTYNSNASVNEQIADTAYTGSNPYWADLDIHVDLTDTHPGDSPVLDIMNVLSDPFAHTGFSNQTSPSGSADQWFQLSAARSSSGWRPSTNGDGGAALARIRLFDGATLFRTLGYYDYNPEDHPVMRVVRFPDPWPDTVKTYTAILNLLRPDEDPGSANDYTATRTVAIHTSHSMSVASVVASIETPNVHISETTTASAVSLNSSSEALSWRVVSWSSLNASIATVNSTTGEVTGVAAGSTTIRALSDDLVHYSDVGVTVSALPTISSFAYACHITPIDGHSYNVFTGSWTVSDAGTGDTYYLAYTTDSLAPNPGTSIGEGHNHTSAVFTQNWRNDTSDGTVLWFWIRYTSLGAWYPMDGGPVSVGYSGICDGV